MSTAPVKAYTPKELQARAEAWYHRQIASIAKAHGTSWPKHKDWIDSYLREEIRERLHALGWRAKA